MQRDIEAATAVDGELPIAAFAVSKGGVVIKHIFLNAPPPDLMPRREGGPGGDEGASEDADPPVTVGRHPDCHVLVDHPSVSRFHLELRARRRQHRITVTDLNSVHGTWVSGRRIPPNTPVDMAAGDTLRLGASRREYRLLWLSLCEAFEMEGPLPPLVEEGKEEADPACQESSNQLAPGQRDLVDTHKDTSQKIVSENIASLQVIPSAPPMHEFVQSFYDEQSAFPQFNENSEDVTKKNLLDKSLVSESLGSLIIKDMPATVTNTGRTVQSTKRDASSQVSRRTKLKSVKSLHVDTGRNRDKSSTSSYTCRKEEQNDILLCSQNCGIQCATCIALFGISEFVGPYHKEEMTAEKKGHMNPPASITMGANKKGPRESNIPQDSVDNKSERSLSLLHPVELSDPVSENTSVPEVKLNDLSTHNYEGSVFNNENVAPNKIAEVPKDTQPEEFQNNEEISPLDKENITTYVSENTAASEVKLIGMSSPLEGSISNSKIVEGPTDCRLRGTICGNLFGNLDAEVFEDNEEISPLDKENITSDVSGDIVMERSNRGLIPNKIAEGPKDCQLEGTICGNLFGNLDTEIFEDNEEISPLDKENFTPYVSGGTVMERSSRGLKPTISQELMDSISPLHLDHDIFSGKESSVLNIGNELKSNEPTSENLGPIILADTEVQQNQVEVIPISHLKFGEAIRCSQNSEFASGKYDAISPVRHDSISSVRHEELFSDKENVTPASRDQNPIVRRALGSRMDDSVSAEKTSDMGIHKWRSSELSAKSKDFHTVDDDVFYSDKENLTPVSSQGMKARKGLPKNISVDAHQDQEAFFSDKENSTPVSSAPLKTRNVSENRARIESVITKKRVVDRLPFQTLLSNSPSRPTSSLGCNCAVARAAATGDLGITMEVELDNDSLNLQESGRTGIGMKAWTMVADTDSLLDDESRKSIMLLKGLKGTHLIIPRIVIRELDSLKQREGLFRRSSKATSILQWINECMENESWWIHVQSTSEMFLVAPTPPATPSAQCIDEEIKIGSSSFNPMALFSPRSFVDIVSPKPEDRVLDCALLFRKLRSDQNMVILSNSITLKIKAMAEGLLCEGAKEFRESLMNPCSDRFMWAASMPRGSAWSCLDEATLAQNYYNSHHHELKRTPRTVQAAKGLKLVLRHNSLLAQATNPGGKTPLASLASV